VNKAKPLPTRLINELLPETRSVLLPRDLSARRIPSNYAGTWIKTPFPFTISSRGLPTPVASIRSHNRHRGHQHD
jgi:hypothetical protein